MRTVSVGLPLHLPASYDNHPLLATINVIRSVIATAAQPTAAKIADVFGQVELIFVSVVFNVVGTIKATATNVQAFAGGSVLYQVGYTYVILLVEVIIAGITSLRTRLFFSCILALPFLINTWVSGNITQAVITNSTWIVWELQSSHPMVPFHLLRDRVVWGALGIACMLNFVWYLQGDYLYTVLIVAFDFSILGATRSPAFTASPTSWLASRWAATCTKSDTLSPSSSQAQCSSWSPSAC